MVRMPFSDTGLTEANLELPVQLFYRFHRRLELSVSSFSLFERAKTPPIFLDAETTEAALKSGKTIRYYAGGEELRPALTVLLAPGLSTEAGFYFRIKQLTFIDKFAEEPDFRLMDFGADASLRYAHKAYFSARLRYDYAHRRFTNLRARPSTFCPIGVDTSTDPRCADPLGKNLVQDRHLIGVYLRGRIWGPFGIYGSYGLRLVRDNGDYFSHNEHLIGGGLTVSWAERLEFAGGVSYLYRRYSKRSDYVGNVATGEGATKNMKVENALVVSSRLGVKILSWLEALVTYEMDDAGSDIEDLLIPNHRVLGGISFAY
jgi:hypothetical protein